MKTIPLWAVCLLPFGAQAATNPVSLLWTQRYSTTNDFSEYVRGMALDQSGNVILTGWRLPRFGAPSDTYTVKYAATNGALLWEQSIAYVSPAAMVVDRNGNAIMTGYFNKGETNYFYTAKLAGADGALLWEQRYSGNLDEHGTALALDTNGNVIVVGNIDFYKDEKFGEVERSRSYIAKYAAADGALLWEAFGRTNEQNEARAVAVDSAGDVIVTGDIGLDYASDFLTVKYAGTNGMKLWERRYDGPTHDEDKSSDVAIDPQDNVVVTGESYGTGAYTAKYAAADGALLWENHNSGLAGSIVIDRSGNVFWAGTTIRFNWDFGTVKYAAADGALLWEKIYDSGDSDLGGSLALDNNGNPIRAGTSVAPDHDFYTIKYASADGTVLWEERYGRGAWPSVATGPGGTVVVAGSGSGGGKDYLTVVYRESLPPLSIAKGTNDGWQVSFAGTSGLRYRLERASGLSGPWETVAVSPTISGIIQFSDTNSPTGQAFYRVAQP